MLIGISGKAGCGKDYITQNWIIPFLQNELQKSCLQLSFADQIKVNVMTQNDIDYNDVYVNKTKDTRKLLQLEGTEYGRMKHGKDIWIKYFSNWVDIFKKRGIKNIITPDVRFINEIDYIKSNGGIVIRIIAPLRNEKRLQEESGGDINIYNDLKNHISECELDKINDSEFDFVIYNDISDGQDIQMSKLQDFLRLKTIGKFAKYNKNI
jgi:phosphomevalonate kinase